MSDESNEQWSPEEQQEMRAAFGEWKAARATKEPTGTIELQSRHDAIKEGQWYEWTAVLIKPDGSVVEGTVQACGDGDMIAKETFEEL